MLLGGLPVETLDSYDWQNHCVALPTDVHEGRSDADRQAAWARIIYKRIRRTPHGPPKFESTRIYTWEVRTEGEMALGSAIRSSTTIQLGGRGGGGGVGQVGVRQDALFFTTTNSKSGVPLPEKGYYYFLAQEHKVGTPSAYTAWVLDPSPYGRS